MFPSMQTTSPKPGLRHHLHEALQARAQAMAQLGQQVMVSEDSSTGEEGSKLE